MDPEKVSLSVKYCRLTPYDLHSALAHRLHIGRLEIVTMKIIPFSSDIEFQRQSYRAVRSGAYAESAVWAVCALSSLIGIFLSFGQLSSNAPESKLVKAAILAGHPVCESVSPFQAS